MLALALSVAFSASTGSAPELVQGRVRREGAFRVYSTPLIQGAWESRQRSPVQTFTPAYPPTMRKDRPNWDVVVLVRVDSSGSVLVARPVFGPKRQTGIPAFDSAAVAAARRWLFEPLHAPNVPRRHELHLRFSFVVRPLAPGGEGSLCGVCLDRATGRPLTFVNIRDLEDKAGPIDWAVGRFCITDLAVGHHRVRFDALGYMDEEVELEVNANRHDSLTVLMKPRP